MTELAQGIQEITATFDGYHMLAKVVDYQTAIWAEEEYVKHLLEPTTQAWRDKYEEIRQSYETGLNQLQPSEAPRGEQ